MYLEIFITNVLSILEQKNMTNKELSKRSGVSESYISDLTRFKKDNPTIETLGQIASGLDVSLPHLLECTDLDLKSLHTISKYDHKSDIPTGYKRLTVILPNSRAFMVEQWAEEAKKRLKEIERQK